MDDELRDLERAARADPGDLAAGRAYAEALRRRGDRPACFLELARLGGLGDLDARRAVREWLPWPGSRGHGNTAYRPCRPVRASPVVKVFDRFTGGDWRRAEAVSEVARWRLLGGTDDGVVVATVPETLGPVRIPAVDCVRVRTGDLSAAWRATLPAYAPILHGELLAWADDRSLCLAAVDDLRIVERWRLREAASDVHAMGDALLLSLWSRTGDSPHGARPVAVSLAPESGERWTRVLQGHLLGVFDGAPLVECRLDGEGVPIDSAAPPRGPGEAHRTVLRLLDPRTGEVSESSDVAAGWLWLLARDDEGLLLERGDHQTLELREALSAPARWSVPRDELVRASPVLGEREVVIARRSEMSMMNDVVALERSSGAVRWSASVPGIREWERWRAGVAQGPPFHAVLPVLAAADGVVYAAWPGLDHVGVRCFDLTTGRVRFDLRVPAATCPPDWEDLHLMPQDNALLVLIRTATGATLARLR